MKHLLLPHTPTLQPLRWLGALSLGLAVPGSSAPLALGNHDPAEEEQGKLPGMDMLVEGSILQKVILPQYDEAKNLTSVLRAQKLTLVAENTIDAVSVRIDFFNPDRSPKASIDLEKARLINKILHSDQAVELVSDDLSATGTGLVYDTTLRRGFVLGPATASTLVETDQSTSMISTPPLRIAVAGAALMTAAAVSAEGLQKLSEAEVAGLNRLAVSSKPKADALDATTQQQLAKAKEKSDAADEALSDFLTNAALDVDPAKAPDLTTKVPEPETKPTYKLPANIRCKDGFYFDPVANVLVFLTDVEVDHPEFTLRGADELKVFLETKEAKQDEAKADKDGGLSSAKFGKPSKMVANGTLKIEKKKNPNKKDDESLKASGRQMVYEMKNKEIIIRGGQPWIISDSLSGYIEDPNGYFRINLKAGTASANGTVNAFAETE